LIRRIRQLGFDVIVVDDGSTDQTARTAAETGAMVISHLRNQGKGQALRTGFAYALRSGYDAVVTLDGDGQHDPSEIPRLLEAAAHTPGAIVVGSRLSVNGSPMPLARRLTNRLMSWVVSQVTRQDVHDSQCGFRVIPRRLLEAVPLSSRRFEIETELLLSAARLGWTIRSVPVKTIYDGHHSHIRPVRDGIRFARLILRFMRGRAR